MKPIEGPITRSQATAASETMAKAEPTAPPKPPPPHVGPGRGHKKNADSAATRVLQRGSDYLAGRIKAKAAKGVWDKSTGHY